ncbi:MAG: hypothetical protein IJ679_00475 [Lachnospiraceae bacterium]|nr:hypothetical protein [Lachnospiraceae bacterium]
MALKTKITRSNIPTRNMSSFRHPGISAKITSKLSANNRRMSSGVHDGK